MKIIAVRIGDRYGPEYETYLENKLPEYDFTWIREPMADNIKLQWNKIYGMTLDIDEPICVMDIDILLINDYKKVFEYPIERGQFLAMPGWWRDIPPEEKERFSINGGFYKYYPKDCHYIYEKFMSHPEYWQRKYIEEGFTSGPINGEQHFIEDSVNEKLELVRLPNEWFCRMEAREEPFARHTLAYLNRRYTEVTGNPYMFMDGFHPDIKFVHFTHMNNHPSNWKHYSAYKN
jgi:hypothetical protein